MILSNIITRIVLALFIQTFLQPSELQGQEITLVTYLDYEIFTDYVEDYLTLLNRELDKHDIRLHVPSDRETIDSLDENLFPLRFQTTFDGNRIASSLLLEYTLPEPVLSQLSPILDDGIFHDRGIPFSGPIEQTTQLSTAIILYGLGRCDEALPYLSELREDTKVARAATLYFANCELVQERYEAAIEAYKTIVLDAGGSHFYTISTKIAWAYLQLNQRDAAFEAIDLAINDEWQTDNNRAEGLAIRAQLNTLINDHSAAIADMNSAVELSPDNPALYTLRGQMYLNIYEWDQSLDDYNTALELAPDYAEAYFQRGLLYYSILQTGDALREEALADFKTYLDLDPDGPHADEARRYIETIEAAMQALGE